MFLEGIWSSGKLLERILKFKADLELWEVFRRDFGRAGFELCFVSTQGFGKLRRIWSSGELLDKIWRVMGDLELGKAVRTDLES